MSLNRIWIIMKWEFIHIIRDPLSLAISLFMPFFMLFLFGYSLCFELRNMPTAVFDMDQSNTSRDYIQAINTTPYFNVKYNLTTYKQSVDFLNKGTTKLVVVIPSHFGRRIKENQPAQVQAMVDGSFINSAQFIVNYLYGINASYSSGIITKYLNSKGTDIDLEPVHMSVRTWYNQSLRDFTFSITGIYSIIMMGFIPLLSALAIVKEKESGSIQQIFVSPVKPPEYIAGKMIPYVLFLGIDNVAVLLFGVWWFDLPFRGNAIMLTLAVFMMVFATVAIGFFISTLTKNQLTAMLLGVVFTLMPAFIFGDSITPILNIPEGWRLYACLFPARFFTGFCRAILLKGSGITGYWKDALSLFVYCIAIFSLASWTVKKKKIM
ncbi:MAG: ABC transporter permease [Deltaproteobacteria bacterium]|nr:ABC transporter permease [Deltaproteobacteria bacterium]